SAILTASGAGPAFTEAHGGDFSSAKSVDFLLRDPANPGRITAAVEAARQNTRMVRTAVTREVWEAVNDMHLDMVKTLAEPVDRRDLPDVLQNIRRHSALVRGMVSGTMLRDEIYSFLTLGTFLERADATARMLDVKYYILLPKDDGVGSELDLAQWQQMLRSFGVNRAFLGVHGTEYTAQNMADFLILDARMPRSLAHCTTRVGRILERIADYHGGPAEPQTLVADLRAKLAGRDADGIIRGGLHEFLDGFVTDVAELSNSVATTYRFTA
ncbi:MAG: alpha-E domain-containing protein, partial [Pseudomonadota bacterium]